MTKIFEQLLKQRGLDEDFLHPNYDELFDPFAMQDMQKAVDRIELAREKNEKVLIFGDYDADGVTASSVMQAALLDFGVLKIEVVLPDRFKDGFGLKMSAVPRILESDAGLVVTVDNGSMANEVCNELKKHGIDVIVTDHHEIPVVPDKAVATINPNRVDEKCGKGLAGVGVAFQVARALNMRKNGGKCDGQEKWLLDLVTIGTICDLMPLIGVNRTLTYWGMTVLKKTRRAGIRELAKLAKGNLEHANSQTIGFQLGPRINAAGRLESANLAYDLLNAETRARAFALAGELDELNKKRKKMQETIVAEAHERISDDDFVNVVCGDWHEGVVGIAAGHLVEEFKRPAIVLARLEDGILKGSGRSFGEFSLGEALRVCDDLLLTGGGHAAACGLSLEASNFDAFKKRINEYYASLGLKNQEKFLRAKSDIILKDLKDVNCELYDEIQLLEPFGEGNTEPIFELRAKIKSRKILKEKHLSLSIVDKDGKELRLMAFYAPKEWLEVSAGVYAKVQFTLSLNEWGGRKNVEGQIISINLDK